MSRKRSRDKSSPRPKNHPRPSGSGAGPSPNSFSGSSRPNFNSILSRLMAQWGMLAVALAVTIAVAAGIALSRAKPRSSSATLPNPQTSTSPIHPSPFLPTSVTFNRDIAPIVYQRCAICHHAGQAAPFPLLAFADAQKHAKLIVQVTQRRYMPPWLPEQGYGEFRNNPRLSDLELALIKRWFDDGTPEGNPADLAPAPHFAEGWQLGEPDLVLTLPQAYNLAAEGKDVYRNLVTPIPMPRSRFVRGVEFHPGNPRVIHHAFIDVDQTRQSRRLAAKQNPPGIDGMEVPESATMPEGQLLGWQPGHAPSFAAPGLSWFLRTNTDLVLQLHLHPSGKPEVVQPALGFFFTDQPPTNSTFRIGLKCFSIDIPAGATHYEIEESYQVPVDVNVLRVEPHAHYLCKDMQACAILPSGEKRSMIWIKDWDFNWQGDFEYTHPQFLPAGTRLVMHYTYDNSTNNVRNPNQPPQRVRFGLNTTDEMGEIWFQGLLESKAQKDKLANNYLLYLVQRTMAYDFSRVRFDPNDADAHARLGHDLLAQGKVSEATNHLADAIRARPDYPKPHYELALFHVMSRNWPAAFEELRTVLRLEPDNSLAYGNLGWVFLNVGKKAEARAAFESALRIDPDDSLVRDYLNRLVRGEL